MDEIETLKIRLREMNVPQLERLQKKTGVTMPTILKIRSGSVGSPRYCNARALMRQLKIKPFHRVAK